jgi:hypothetical protein
MRVAVFGKWPSHTANASLANVGHEAELWQMTNTLHASMDAMEGIQFVVNDKGQKGAVLIDLRTTASTILPV